MAQTHAANTFFRDDITHILLESLSLAQMSPSEPSPNCSFAFVLSKTEIIRVQQCVILLHRIVSRQKEAGKLPDN